MTQRDPSDPIYTPDQRLRVFVSSTLEELADERRAARAAVERLRLTPVMFELGARPYPPRMLYRAYLEQSQIFVGLYWQRYGWVAPGEAISGLEDELRLAGDRPKLLYVKRPAAEREPRLEDLLRTVEAEGTASYKTFGTAEELRDLLENDLALLLTERFAQRGAPGPRSPSAPRLPVPTTPLVGRREEVEEGVRTLLDEEARLLTLLGPGGIGKTRLALAVAHALRTEFADGAHFVALADVRDAAQVFDGVAAALGATVEGGTAALDAVKAHLQDKDALLVLDNFEQVVDAAADVAELLRAAPGLKVLVTSRVALRLTAERLHAVEPLGLPTGSVIAGDAVDLFLQRVRAVRPDLDPDGDDLRAVGEIVRRLDGVPLAIELAAARTHLLSLWQLASRLDEGLDILARGSRDLPDRQRTLRATLDWSYQLLPPFERQLFARLGTFMGGFTLDAGVAIGGPEAREAEVLDALNSLVEHSLVRVSPAAGGARLGMLEIVREYAAERLEEAADREEVRARHARFYLDLAERFGPRTKLEQRWSASVLAAERANLDRAIAWCLARGRFEEVVRFGWALWLYWWIHNEQEHALPWFARLLAAPLDERDTVLARTVAGALHVRRGDAAHAGTLFDEAFEASRGWDDTELEALLHCGLGLVALARTEYERAEGHFGACLELFRRRQDAWGIAFAHVALARVALARGEAARALRLTEPLVATTLQAGDENTAAWILHVKGIAEIQSKAWGSASRDLTQSLELFWCLGNLAGTAHVIGTVAVLAFALDDLPRAARLAGAAESVAEAVGALPFQPERTIFEEAVRSVRAGLGGDYASHEAGGRALTAAEAFEEARGWVDVAAPA